MSKQRDKQKIKDTLYLIRLHHNNIMLYKIGITSDYGKRAGAYGGGPYKTKPYSDYNVKFKSNKDLVNLEGNLKAKLKSKGYNTYKNHTEYFIMKKERDYKDVFTFIEKNVNVKPQKLTQNEIKKLK